MGKIVKTLFLVILTIGLSCGVNAQSLKIGYVDSSSIMEVMPERTKIEQDLQAYYSDLQSELQAMGTEYQNKMKDYEANSNTMSNLIRQSKEKEILDLQRRIQEFQDNAENSFEDKRVELLTPLIEKIQNAINVVGKEKGFTYVLDKSVGVVVYIGENAIDITSDVKTQLGL